jgi:DNA-binding NarL/FixJ family response regulator
MEPDVVLMDLRMPGIGGLEAARMIVDSLSFTQVIVLTAYDGPLPTRSAQDAGAYAYLVKGCPITLMKDVIEQAWHFHAGLKGRLRSELGTGTLPPS